MADKPKKEKSGMGCDDYEIERSDEDTIIKVNCENCPYSPSIEDNPICMSKTVDKLTEVENATRLVFTQKRDYEYDHTQTKMLQEIAELYIRFIKEKSIFNISSLGASAGNYAKFYNERYTEIRNLAFNTMKKDPISAYVELIRIFRREKIRLLNTKEQSLAEGIKKYMQLIQTLISDFEKTKLITIAKPYIAGFKVGSRDIYRRIFNPLIKPDFMFTKIMASYPKDGIELDTYNIQGTEVTIFELPDNIQYIYHIMPPEFRLEEEEYELLDAARNILAEHKPDKEDFVNPERMREVFKHVGKDLLTARQNKHVMFLVR